MTLTTKTLEADLRNRLQHLDAERAAIERALTALRRDTPTRKPRSPRRKPARASS